ncbi:SRPBCC family protein [Zoogloea sp.]|uniref:SRPBCC family protein n=1 Tax=Zoogloea sp. TaxID=49181 RepID=UPI0035AE8455
MRFEHLVEINDPKNPLIDPLSREQLWTGLMFRVEEPGIFLPGLDRCEILSRSPERIERALHFGSTLIHDSVSFVPQEWVRFESAANAEHAGGKLTIRIEAPDALSLYLRFTYETTLPDGAEAGAGLQVSEFVKSAYRESDLDTVRIIRMIAANGRPQ